jgi:hypothetical protein
VSYTFHISTPFTNHAPRIYQDLHLDDFLADLEAIMPTLYLLKRHLSAIALSDQTTMLFDSPTNDGRSFTVDGERLSLEDFKHSADRLMIEIETKMDELLWDQFHLPTDATILDDPRNRSVGFSFATNPDNSWIGDCPVLQYIIRNRFDQFAVADSSIPGGILWKPVTCDAFMQDAFEIQKLLAISLIVTGGEPARSTEYASMLYTHTPTCTIRNLYWMLDTVVVVGTYNKSTASTGQDVRMARIPLPKFGKLFARFLIYVRPVMIEWQRIFRPKLLQNAKTFLFMGFTRPVGPADFTLWLADWSTREIGVRLTVSRFRQFMSFLSKYHHRLYTLVAIRPPGMAAQLGHNQRTDTRNYGGTRHMLPGYDQVLFVETALVSAITHMLFGHEPELLRTLYKSEAHMKTLEEHITAILYPSLPFTQQSHIPKSPLDGPEIFTDAVQQFVVPAITSSRRRDLAEIFSAFIDHLQLFRSPQTHPIPVDDTVMYPHPYLHAKLCEFMKTKNGLFGFKNREQAIVSQLLYEAGQHVLYVSGTGILFSFLIALD